VVAWEFGRTVRHWRDRVRPTAVGIPVGRRRRAAGLRREELAGLEDAERLTLAIVLGTQAFID
jgi:hypothetical protein